MGRRDDPFASFAALSQLQLHPRPGKCTVLKLGKRKKYGRGWGLDTAIEKVDLLFCCGGCSFS
jgi:hypothetical protein